MPIIPELMQDLEDMKELHRKKNDDYASTDNPFSNFDISEYGLRLFSNARDQSFIWPIFTKLARLSTLLNSRNDPNNESIGDSLKDIAVYCLLWKADIGRRNSCPHYWGEHSNYCRLPVGHEGDHKFLKAKNVLCEKHFRTPSGKLVKCDKPFKHEGMCDEVKE